MESIHTTFTIPRYNLDQLTAKYKLANLYPICTHYTPFQCKALIIYIYIYTFEKATQSI